MEVVTGWISSSVDQRFRYFMILISCSACQRGFTMCIDIGWRGTEGSWQLGYVYIRLGIGGVEVYRRSVC